MSYRLTAHFGSMRTTLALLALLAVVVMATPSFTPLTVALGLLAVNLVAALFVHPLLRRQLPLLVFHLALLALLVLVGAGRMASLDGRFELTQGVPFDGHLLDKNAGPLYDAPLHRLAFTQHGFEIDYAPGRQRGATRNRVSWQGDDGSPRSAVIGDHRPLVIDGHRIYTSPNKGFAPLLRWQPVRGEAVLGAVHLPSFPMHELRQSREWALPDGREAWVMLQFDGTLIDPKKSTTFRLPDEHRLVVRIGEMRTTLAPGERVAIDGGALVYEGLATWMGYRVAYDPTLPWLLAASLLAALSLAWHYARKFFSVPAAVRLRAATEVAHG
jgi:cytochrome c biogenesis protein